MREAAAAAMAKAHRTPPTHSRRTDVTAKASHMHGSVRRAGGRTAAAGVRTAGRPRASHLFIATAGTLLSDTATVLCCCLVPPAPRLRPPPPRPRLRPPRAGPPRLRPPCAAPPRLRPPRAAPPRPDRKPVRASARALASACPRSAASRAASPVRAPPPSPRARTPPTSPASQPLSRFGRPGSCRRRAKAQNQRNSQLILS